MDSEKRIRFQLGEGALNKTEKNVVSSAIVSDDNG